jgi:hypothetical protein
MMKYLIQNFFELILTLSMLLVQLPITTMSCPLSNL